MDPSILLCSFKPCDQAVVSVPWTSFPYVAVNERIIGAKTPVNPEYVDEGRYKQLTSMKLAYDKVDSKTFSRARDACNPFEKIGNGGYSNRAAMKLANIDAVTGICTFCKPFDMFNPSTDYPLVYADVAAGPGGFTQHIQSRYPLSTGYGMTLKGDLDFDPNFIDFESFTSFYGSHGDGDLYKHSLEFQKMIIEGPGGVDLLMADGGIEMDQDQEYHSSNLLICQAFLGMSCVREGGNFVLKVFDTVNKLSGDVLYCLSMCYDQVVMFKPVTSRPANSERYFLCKNRLEQDDTDLLTLFQRLLFQVKKGVFFESIITRPSKDFIRWLEQGNEENLQRQLEYNGYIQQYLSGDKDIVNTIPQYMIHKFEMLWHLPL